MKLFLGSMIIAHSLTSSVWSSNIKVTNSIGLYNYNCSTKWEVFLSHMWPCMWSVSVHSSFKPAQQSYTAPMCHLFQQKGKKELVDCFSADKVPLSSTIIGFAYSTFTYKSCSGSCPCGGWRLADSTRSVLSPADIHSSQSSHSI